MARYQILGCPACDWISRPVEDRGDKVGQRLDYHRHHSRAHTPAPRVEFFTADDEEATVL